MSHVPALTAAVNATKAHVLAGNIETAAQDLNTYIDSLGDTDQGEAAIGGDAYDMLVAACNQLDGPEDEDSIEDRGEDSLSDYVNGLLDDVLAIAKA